jgi:predicted acylesterase/phospholipase RssA
MFTGLINKSGLFDTSPLFDFISSFLNKKGGIWRRRFVVSTVDVNTGSYITLNETTTEAVKAIVSSASIPFIFPN